MSLKGIRPKAPLVTCEWWPGRAGVVLSSIEIRNPKSVVPSGLLVYSVREVLYLI